MLPFIQWSALSSLRPFMYPCIDQSFSPDSQGCSCERWAAPCSPVALPGAAAACQSSDTAFSVSYHRWKPGCDVPAMGQRGKRVKKMKRHLNYPKQAHLLMAHNTIFLFYFFAISKSFKPDTQADNTAVLLWHPQRQDKWGQTLTSHYYRVHGAESAHTVVAFTFPEGQGSLSLEVLHESVKFCKRKTIYSMDILKGN